MVIHVRLLKVVEQNVTKMFLFDFPFCNRYQTSDCRRNHAFCFPETSLNNQISDYTMNLRFKTKLLKKKEAYFIYIIILYIRELFLTNLNYNFTFINFFTSDTFRNYNALLYIDSVISPKVESKNETYSY